MKQKVAFIIVAYRPNMEELRRLLTSLKDYPTIIVDNTGTLTRGNVARATLLSQKQNVGFGAAANIGIRHASAHGAKWFVILNQDTVISKESARVFVTQLKKIPPSVSGPFTGALDSKRWTTILPSEKVEYVTGSCIAIHVNVVTKVGYFFEPYFLYYEDADYSVRAKLAGFPIIKLDLPNIRHEETMVLGKGSKLHQYYLARNHFLFVKRLAPLSVKLHEWLRAAKTLFEHLIRREHGSLLGILDFLFGRFGAYQGRGA